ncbi:hypothetical protein [Neptunomonas sp.]|uniref:hypothetical protein n=1 Tax=Neptunomonas sp. TaxID=1971898 RepID=UPI00356A794A
MISDFPTKEDFFKTSEDYLNSSWDSVVELLSEFDEILGVIEDSPHANEADRYWGSAKQTLITATALVQQAVEFYIKGKIVHISPYLLISGNPQSWPKDCSKNDIPFSTFRSIDAQDLIKVHDTVCNERFSDKFIQWNERLRVIRNKAMHTVDKTLTVKPEEVIEFILFAYHYFSEDKDWFKSRRRYLGNTPVNSVRHIKEEETCDSYLVNSLLYEFRIIVNVLSPSLTLRYLNFDKKTRSHHCPNCYKTISKMDFFDHEFMEGIGETYQKKKGMEVYECCICNYSGTFIAQKCGEDDCEGEKLDAKSGLCLSCGFENTL